MVSEGQGQFSELPTQRVRLLRTKLFVPRAHPDFVSRPRLLEQLDQGQSCKMTLISAPAGFGKTSLLCDWIFKRGIKIAWVSLDASDNDLSRFWTYVVASLDSLHPDIAGRILKLLQAPQSPPVDTVLAELLNEVATISDELTLVLDDYHFIESSSIHRSLAFLLDNLPPRVHLIIASRSDPPLPLARFRARRQLAELRARDLRFTEEEAAVLLNQVTGLGLPSRDIAILENRTEGWAAGLQLAALSLQSVDDAAHFVQVFSGSHRFVFDYLAQEVLRRQPVPVKSFLLKTAILDRLCDSLCNSVAEVDNGRAMLDRLEQTNLFIVPLDQERKWYRYHHLFADFLRAHAAQEFGEEVMSTLHLRASNWYETNGFVEEAVGSALSSADYQTAANLIERYAGEMFVRSELGTIVSWSKAIPEAVTTNRQKLCMTFAWSHLAIGNHEEAERYLQTIERSLGKTVEALGTDGSDSLSPGTMAALVEISVIRSSLAGASFDVPNLRRLTGLALPYLENDSLPFLCNGPAELRPVAAFNKAVAHEMEGEVVLAGEAFAEAFSLSYEQKNLHLFPMALSHLGQMQIAQGKLYSAEATYRRALQLSSEFSGVPSPLAGSAYTGLGNLCYEWNDLDAAVGNFEEGLILSRKWSNWEGLLTGYIGLARVKVARMDWTGAFGLIEELAGICRSAKMGMLLPALESVKARFSLAHGNLRSAILWIETSGITIESEPSFLREAEGLILARILLTKGRVDEAQQLLSRLLEVATSAHRVGRVIEGLAVQALAFKAQGQIPQALDALKAAFTLAEPEGFVRSFVDEGESMLGILRIAQEQDVAPAYVSRLIAAFQGQVGKVSKSIRQDSDLLGEHLPATSLPSTSQGRINAEPLSDRELEVIRLIASGLTNEEVANNLVVSVNTVKTHLKNIYGKLDARNRTQAISAAREQGIL